MDTSFLLILIVKTGHIYYLYLYIFLLRLYNNPGIMYYLLFILSPLREK